MFARVRVVVFFASGLQYGCDPGMFLPASADHVYIVRFRHVVDIGVPARRQFSCGRKQRGQVAVGEPGQVEQILLCQVAKDCGQVGVIPAADGGELVGADQVCLGVGVATGGPAAHDRHVPGAVVVDLDPVGGVVAGVTHRGELFVSAVPGDQTADAFVDQW